MTGNFGQNLRTAIVRMTDGRRVPLQVDAETGLPIVGDNVWLVVKRAPYRSVETILGDITMLSIVRSWAAKNHVPLVYRFRNETFLSEDEIRSLAAELRNKKRKRSGSHSKVVSDQKWRSRFDSTSTYFRYLATAYLSRSSPYSSNAPFDNFMEAWTGSRPKRSSRARVGLTPKQIALVLTVTEPGHPQNPWHRRTQVRNRVIILLMLLCGLRLGEVLSLRMKDLRVRGSFPTIDVRRRPPDPTDKRRIPPKPKTLGRRLPLPGKVADAVNRYVLADRVKAPGFPRQQFLILTRDGKPCSKEAVQSMIRVLRKSNSVLKGLIGHRLRNSFTDLAQEALKNNTSLNKEQKPDVLTYMGGWSKMSKQPSRYSEAWLSEQVESVILAIHDNAFGISS